jgi:hypothetical protein
LLLVGGSGIAFGWSNFTEAIKASVNGKAAIRRLELVWMIRSRGRSGFEGSKQWLEYPLTRVNHSYSSDDVAFIREELVRLGPKIQASGMQVRLTIHLTSSTVLPTLGEDMALNDLSDSNTLPFDLPSVGATITSTASSASSVVEEKNETEKPCSIAPHILEWKAGRPDLDGLVSDFISSADGEVYIGVCGPSALLASAKSATRKASSSVKALQGRQKKVFFASEAFGW